jgi:sn-glycerol 3-phosphate transport system substrate-binding protein
VEGAPQNSIIGGATLWVLAGHDDADYKGVAQFFTFLSSPENQADWHQFTGYLPITMAAYELTKQQGFYEKNPGTEVSIKQMTNKEPTENSKGLRFGSFVQIRDIINEELEAIWAGSKTTQEGLDAAVARGNELLRKFESANK